MLIHDIRLLHFRNYDDERVEFPPSIVVLYGKNGQGKTNLLEALYMASIGKSYRGLTDADLIHWQQQTASVILNFSRSGVMQQIKMILSKETKKELWVNETKVSRRELIGTLNEVLFSPEDLQLIKAGPALRRRFLDRELSQVSPVYCQTLLRYHRAVAQRNLLLKRMKYEKVQSLDEWDRQIASLAADIVQRRLEALHKICWPGLFINVSAAAKDWILPMCSLTVTGRGKMPGGITIPCSLIWSRTGIVCLLLSGPTGMTWNFPLPGLI